MPERNFSPVWRWLGVILAVAVLVAFVMLTPPALLRRADYIGAAVCHRILSHSFEIEGQQLPVCQRCTGTFSGALTGLIMQWAVLRRRRQQGFPPLKMLLLLGFFLGMWGGDGLNSFLGMRFNNDMGMVYVPQPWLRLLTGTLVGMGMSMILVPAFNLTLWRDGVPDPAVSEWRDFAKILAVELAMAAVIYTLEPWLLYPISLYSVAGVLAMFVCLGAMIFVMTLGREGCCESWRGAWVPLLWGIVFAGVMVGGMNLGRFWLTGTIDGVPTL